MVTFNVRDKFLLVKSTKKNVLKGVNFINLKTSGGYIAKSKSQGVCLQLSQTQGVIMHFSQLIIKKLRPKLKKCGPHVGDRPPHVYVILMSSSK